MASCVGCGVEISGVKAGELGERSITICGKCLRQLLEYRVHGMRWGPSDPRLRSALATVMAISRVAWPEVTDTDEIAQRFTHFFNTLMENLASHVMNDRRN